MSEPVVSLANPIMKDIGPTAPRVAQKARRLGLPAESVIVSADGHWEVTQDIFYDGFPEAMKSRAPRVWFDEHWRLGYRGKAEAEIVGERMKRTLKRGFTDGIRDMAVRQRDLLAEGIQKEIVFPQSLLHFIRLNDFEVQEQIYRVYNEYIADLSKRSQSRFYGVGVFSNWWDPAGAEHAMQQIVDLGLKTFMVPVNPGKNVEGKTISYGSETTDRFWDVVAEAGLPLNFHVGENIETEGRGALGTTALTSFGPFRKSLGQLIFGGVFDRHPDVKVVFSEGGISWVAPALQDAEMIFDTYGNGDLLDPIDNRPTHYWQQNCYATFQDDVLGLRQLEFIGADRVMWASDYPHPEGSFGFTSDSMQSVIDIVGAKVATKILGGTAMDVYKLNS